MHVLALELFEARRLGHYRVRGRHHLAEVEAFGGGNGGPLPAAGLVHQRHFGIADRLAATVDPCPAKPPQIRLAPCCSPQQRGAENSLRCHIHLSPEVFEPARYDVVNLPVNPELATPAAPSAHIRTSARRPSTRWLPPVPR